MNFEREIGDIYRLRVPFEEIYTSVFLVMGDNIILVDSGTTDFDVDNHIVPSLKKMGLSLSDVDFLLFTHSHTDHAGGAKRIAEINPDIKVVSKEGALPVPYLEIYEMKGHSLDSIGLLDLRSETLIAGDGLQGAGVWKYRCYLENREEYLKTAEKMKQDERIKNILHSHSYEPWYSDFAFGRTEVLKRIEDSVAEAYKK